MTSATRTPATYTQMRTIVLLLGLIALTVVGGIMWVRGVEPVEVSATIFFIPLFAAMVFFGLPGGIVMGILASIAYIVVRIPSIQAVGFESLAGLIITRVLGYLVFGAVGGWATSSLGASVRKLERVDRVDDETHLHNARAFVEQIRQEQSRAQRFDGVFSVVILSMRDLELDRRTRASLMQSLGTHLRANVRSVDGITHTRDNGRDLFGFVLPGTDEEGADVFLEKLSATLNTIVPGDHDLDSTVVTFPEQSAALEAVVGEFDSISSRIHPAAD